MKNSTSWRQYRLPLRFHLTISAIRIFRAKSQIKLIYIEHRGRAQDVLGARLWVKLRNGIMTSHIKIVSLPLSEFSWLRPCLRAGRIWATYMTIKQNTSHATIRTRQKIKRRVSRIYKGLPSVAGCWWERNLTIWIHDIDVSITLSAHAILLYETSGLGLATQVEQK